ncbi:hypothetical protein WR25_07898 [Diploscapter pachys]|uniref:NDT80 domain-containing protein n=1 Tax=Diploscapter pachys TaxID=2018661 RepID=A0A2A2LQK3_9BILA|nr:hypothetical protein WR25_07898 [Diploscapter pachys]
MPAISRYDRKVAVCRKLFVKLDKDGFKRPVVPLSGKIRKSRTPIDSPLIDSPALGQLPPHFQPNPNQLEPSLDMRNPQGPHPMAAPQQPQRMVPNQMNPMIQDPHMHPQQVQGQNGMFQVSRDKIQTNRLPDSPPITDISGNGSSASPSSNSDPPYSPDNYGNYSALVHQVVNNNGLILGVGDLATTPGGNGMHQGDVLGAQGNQPRMGAQQMSSPQSVCFLSPYAPSSQQATPNSMAQVSPPPTTQEQYLYNQGGSMDLYSILAGSNEGSLNSQTSEAPQHRKRPRMDNTMMPGMIANPMANSPIDSNYADENYSHQVIKFTKFQEEMWNPLYDANEQPLRQLQVHVVADKGFNYSAVDGCFVNQKKNHFQVSVHIEACDNMPPKYVRYQGQLHLVNEFKLAFCGVKAEMTTSEIQIKQSKTDRKPIPHDPVVFEIHER